MTGQELTGLEAGALPHERGAPAYISQPLS